MSFKASPFVRGARSVTVTINPDGTVSLPARKREDGQSYAPTKIGTLDAETATAIVAAVQDMYDTLRALKAEREAAEETNSSEGSEE